MSVKEQHLFERCPTCDGSGLVPLDAKARACLRVGLAPGTTGDWVECIQCYRGKVEMVERIDIPSSHSLLVDGFRR